MDKTLNRKIMLDAAAEYMGLTKSQAKYRVEMGTLPALVFLEDDLTMGPYRPSPEGERHSIIYVYEKALKGLVKPLPEPIVQVPTGPFVLKAGAAKMLNRSAEWMQDCAERGMLPAWVFADGVNFIPLAMRIKQIEEEGGINARVLHFFTKDILAYQRKIQAYQSEPTVRPTYALSAEQRERAIKMAEEQLRAKGYVSTTAIREELGLHKAYYADLMKLRETYGWPMRSPQVSASRKKAI